MTIQLLGTNLINAMQIHLNYKRFNTPNKAYQIYEILYDNEFYGRSQNMHTIGNTLRQ